MAVWAIADLHLSFGVPNKSMDIFGHLWKEHAEKIRLNWCERIAPEDLVLIAGDISWAMRPQDAIVDLQWIDALPGTKVMIRGNHDYWWGSYAKVKQILPASIHAIQNNAWKWKDIAIGGSRLWDTSEFAFGSIVNWRQTPISAPPTEGNEESLAESEKIYARELQRLEMSLSQMDQTAKLRIAMTHYPPIGLHLEDSRAATLLEQYHIDICVFGHLHSIDAGRAPFGIRHGVKYFLTSCDYLNFEPLRLI